MLRFPIARRWRLWKHSWVLFAAALATHLTTASAWAQKPASLPGEDNGMIQAGVALGIAVLVCIPAFVNPKRSHHR